MRTLIAIVLVVMLGGCERATSPKPVPSTTPTPVAIVPPAAAAPSPLASPAVAAQASPASPAADDDDNDDFDKPSGPDFEIDAEADWYYGYIPMTVHFKARPLNGTPPFKYTWNFGDGSPETTGETAVHFYDTVGRYSAFVVGTDASGVPSRVDLLMGVVTREEYAERKELDVNQLVTVPSPTATPSTP